MSLFRKQPATAPPTTAPDPERESPPEPTSEPPQLFDTSNVDIAAVYRSAKLTADDLDPVARAEALLHQLPKKSQQIREIVEATFRVFGVDQTKILEAARKQLEALEAFIRYSHEHTQRILDASTQRIAELQAEIERSRQAAEQARREGDERARNVNNELIKVQHVLAFFGESAEPEGLDEPTFVSKPGDDDDGRKPPAPAPLPPPPKPVQRR